MVALGWLFMSQRRCPSVARLEVWSCNCGIPWGLRGHLRFVRSVEPQWPFLQLGYLAMVYLPTRINSRISSHLTHLAISHLTISHTSPNCALIKQSLVVRAQFDSARRRCVRCRVAVLRVRRRCLTSGLAPRARVAPVGIIGSFNLAACDSCYAGQLFGPWPPVGPWLSIDAKMKR